MTKKPNEDNGKEVTTMKIIIEGEPKEIAALVLAVRGRQMGGDHYA